MKKKTAGQLSNELRKKEKDYTHSAYDQMREQWKDYAKEIEKCVKRNIDLYPGDFYVVILIKRERLMTNVIRTYYLARESCPTPNYDQIVYKYHRKEEKLEFLWTIPDKETTEYYYSHPLTLSKEEKPLLPYILDFKDGTLLRKAKTLNDEYNQKPFEMPEKGDLKDQLVHGEEEYKKNIEGKI